MLVFGAAACGLCSLMPTPMDHGASPLEEHCLHLLGGNFSERRHQQQHMLLKPL